MTMMVHRTHTSSLILLVVSILTATIPGSIDAFTTQKAIRSPLFVTQQSLASLRTTKATTTRCIALFESTLDTRSLDNLENDHDEDDDNVGAWIPIASAHALRGLGPQSIRVMGLDLVVWRNNATAWSVMADACPHRLAPLSQGRVDDDGCIECPYHGWAFDVEGKLQKLPHASNNTDISRVPGSSANAFPTHLSGDMIFAFLPSSVHGEMFLQSVLPEQMFPTHAADMNANKTYFTRELPYSADFLIENFMDPAHIPFAHNSLQSLRGDAAPVPMELVVSNFTHVEVTFKDVSRGATRDGVVSFQRPTMFHFRTKGSDNQYKTDLNIHIIPIEPGKSRVLFAAVVFDWLPDWLKHAASNRFLNTDSWLHNAEYQARMRSKKFMPYVYATDSDFGVKTFRQWWSRHGFSTAPPNTFGPAPFESLTLLNRQQQIDPWQHHSKQCTSCRQALRVMMRIQKFSLASAILSVLLFQKWPIRASLLVTILLWVRNLAFRFSTVIAGNPSPAGYADRSPAHDRDYEELVRAERKFSIPFLRKQS